MAELRKSHRVSVSIIPEGTLRLILADESIMVQRIGNISPFGIMVQVKRAIDENVEVGLFYTIENMNFEILGTVKWVDIVPDENTGKLAFCRLGISFNPRHVKENMDLFNILTPPESAP